VLSKQWNIRIHTTNAVVYSGSHHHWRGIFGLGYSGVHTTNGGGLLVLPLAVGSRLADDPSSVVLCSLPCTGKPSEWICGPIPIPPPPPPPPPPPSTLACRIISVSSLCKILLTPCEKQKHKCVLISFEQRITSKEITRSDVLMSTECVFGRLMNPPALNSQLTTLGSRFSTLDSQLSALGSQPFTVMALTSGGWCAWRLPIGLRN
jgi:hypothetical protein